MSWNALNENKNAARATIENDYNNSVFLQDCNLGGGIDDPLFENLGVIDKIMVRTF